MNISICITAKNRTKLSHKGKILNLFTNSVESIIDSFKDTPHEFEIVIYDWSSTDTDYSWLPKESKVLVDERTDVFSRGYGLNKAAEESSYENLLFLDTDMLINKSFILNCVSILENNSVYFPICWSLIEKHANLSKESLGNDELYKDSTIYFHNRNSGWRRTGYGMSCMRKSVWEDVGKINVYWKWGNEDSDFHNSIQKKGYDIVRKNDCGLVHQWHPS